MEKNSSVVPSAHLFRPLHGELNQLLRGLAPGDWTASTAAGEWRVRDVAAHLLDGQVRRLASHRDGLSLSGPGADVGYEELVAWLDKLNHGWVDAFSRVSPPLLVDMLDIVGPQLAAFFESLDPLATAFFPVAWAGEGESLNWMDVGRDYTELWHHQAQIREAVGAGLLLEERWVSPLLRMSVQALPAALGPLKRPSGTTVVFSVSGPGGGTWTVTAAEVGWTLSDGAVGSPTAEVRTDADTAWRIFYNALGPDEALQRIHARGDDDLLRAVVRTRSVMVLPPDDELSTA